MSSSIISSNHGTQYYVSFFVEVYVQIIVLAEWYTKRSLNCKYSDLFLFFHLILLGLMGYELDMFPLSADSSDGEEWSGKCK
jgi:hypothetical protein